MRKVNDLKRWFVTQLSETWGIDMKLGWMPKTLHMNLSKTVKSDIKCICEFYISSLIP